MELEELVPKFEICEKISASHILFDKSALVWVRLPNTAKPCVVTRKEWLENNAWEYVCEGPTEGGITEELIGRGFYGVEAMFSRDIHEGATHEHDWMVLALPTKEKWLLSPQHGKDAKRINAFGKILLRLIEKIEEDERNG